MIKCYLFILFTLTASAAISQHTYRNSNSFITIKGTSNINEWKSEAKEAKVNVIMSIDTGLKAIHYLRVEVSVKAIKSSKGEIMDYKTYQAFKADRYPLIIYKFETTHSLVKKGDIFEIKATGFLTMAGVSNKIELLVKAKMNTNKSITFNFSKKLKMTDYGINPPNALFGLLKTGNEVEIIFSLTVEQSS